MKKSNYTKFILMLICSAVSMYITMYFNTYEYNHVYFSWTRMYMTLIGIGGMAIIMFLFMQKMYTNKSKNAAATKDIQKLRIFFEQISEEMILLLKTFGAMDKAIYIEHCPMVNNDKGADWLSLESEIKNPYYGAAMLKCGEVIQEVK